MAAKVPASLRAADCARFAQRGAQLEAVRPDVAYWCYQCAVERIVPRGLHLADAEARAYATRLVDKLEQIKTARPADEAITDGVTARAVVEQFALETFARADETLRARKVTARTAETFLAAATFLDLLKLWEPPAGAGGDEGQLEAEMGDETSRQAAARAKYAKYHAAHILKAIKAGEDPNPPPSPTPSPMQEDGAPAEAAAAASPPPTALSPPPPADPAAALHTPSPQFPAPSPAQRHPTQPPQSPPRPQPPQLQASPPPPIPDPSSHHHHYHHYQQQQHRPPSHGDVSPLDPTPSAPAPHGTASGPPAAGYFPPVPTFAAEEPHPGLPTAPLDAPASPPAAPPPPAPPSAPPDPTAFYGLPPAPQAQSPPPPPPPQQQPRVPSAFASQAPAAGPPPVPTASFQPQPQPQPVAPESFRVDDAAMADAQKHAKWAVSALNFDDVDTAVKELRVALRALGAS
ncbi:Vta1 like-domain-containing protein [Lineolata rhizophorae]|uniref:Vta1 like-domain-containing protein n=1 Tax=Lineolata rhizophorae TaxID=578093 RepID=A0A6A6P7N2_9PEZI|nr:Vta1 like-domain-containing protein [Lineolata rhizophorae]